ncbi:MAG: ABC transporter substrate-binding protein [Anaerolineae bacterium]|nr:ABC transporter substrate-binding protein [Anaerolineae bacterium]
MMLKKGLLIGLTAAFLVFLAACGAPSGEAETAEVGGLKIALLPILDSLPYFVAEQNGYFVEEGVEVEPLVVVSAIERNQLMQSGEIDGMLAELSTVATFNRDEIQLKALIMSRKAYPDAPLFRVLAAPGSDITSASDLAGVPVAIAENTIIEYVTDRLLESEGVPADQIVGESVPAIPERYQLLMEGQIAAATLPDPLAQSAIESGAVPVIDDSAYPEVAVSVLAFSTGTIENNPEALRRFLRAWDRAAGDINADPEAYRGLLLEQVSVPPNIQETYQIPPFPRAELPTAGQWDDVIDWLIEKGLVESAVAYDESVTGDFLP